MAIAKHDVAGGHQPTLARDALDNLLTYLPRGNPLPADVWLSRHRAILALVWLQAACLFIYGLVQNYTLPHSLFEVLTIVFAPGLVELFRLRNRKVRATAASFGLIMSAAVLTHLSGGFIEAHFHFFVMLAVIALYQSWEPFLISILFVLIHHGVAGAIAPGSVFNHPDAIAHPWKWAAIHAGFVSAACVAYIVAWRWNEIAQAHSEHILTAAGEGIIGIDTVGNIRFMNPAAERIIGRKEDKLMGMSLTQFVGVGSPDDSFNAPPSASLSPLETPEQQTVEGFVTRHDGVLPIEFERTAIVERHKTTGQVVTIRDISSRREAERALRESEQRFRSLVQNASDMITVIATDTTIRYQSPSISQVLGYEAEEMVGRKLADFFHPHDVSQVVSFLSEAMARPNRPATVEAKVKHKDGSWHDLHLIGTDQRADQSVGGFVLNIRDVTERKALEEQLRHQAFHDSLTGLANRPSFFERLEHALERAPRSDSRIVVLFIDLDDFKSTNDRFGHDAGDRLLIEVAHRFEVATRQGDTAARLGGDEFGILLEDVADDDYAQVVADGLLEALGLPYVLDGKAINIAASIGVATSHNDGISASDLVRNADIAMYEAKRSGGHRYAVYTQDMSALTLDRLELLADLQVALSREELEVHYQPTVLLKSGRVAGFEALVRWRHPKRGLLLPGVFIRIAEESGIVLPLGRWVLEQACRQAAEWQKQFPSDPPLTMSVNVSVHQLQTKSFVDDVRAALAQSGLDAQSLVLEMTESIMIQNTSSMTDRLNALKELGVRLAIDDFGTGYSSLSYLSQFSFDILKVDKAFIDTDNGPSNNELARAIIEIGKTLKLQVVAEGIERADQLSTLQALDCDLGQGFYFSRPLEAAQIGELLLRSLGRAAAA